MKKSKEPFCYYQAPVAPVPPKEYIDNNEEIKIFVVSDGDPIYYKDIPECDFLIVSSVDVDSGYGYMETTIYCIKVNKIKNEKYEQFLKEYEKEYEIYRKKYEKWHKQKEEYEIKMEESALEERKKLYEKLKKEFEK